MSSQPVQIPGTEATVQVSPTGRTLSITMPGQSTSVTFDHVPTTVEVDDVIRRVTQPLLPVIETAAINIVFDGPPDAEGPRFVEVETDDGRGVRVGDWRPYVGHEPLWVLRIDALPAKVGEGDHPGYAPGGVIPAAPADVSALVTDYPPSLDDGRDEPPMPGLGGDQRVALPVDPDGRGGW